MPRDTGFGEYYFGLPPGLILWTERPLAAGTPQRSCWSIFQHGFIQKDTSLWAPRLLCDANQCTLSESNLETCFNSTAIFSKSMKLLKHKHFCREDHGLGWCMLLHTTKHNVGLISAGLLGTIVIKITHCIYVRKRNVWNLIHWPNRAMWTHNASARLNFFK